VSSTPETLLEVEHLRTVFPLRAPDRRLRGIDAAAVDDVSFRIGRGETLGLVGESGSGKSVTALSIMGLLPRESATVTGSIRYRGSAVQPQRVRGSQIAMIFQEPMSSLNPVFSVGFQIAEVLRKHLGLSGRTLRDRVAQLMEEHIEKPLSLDEIASATGLSRRQIERLFKRHLDCVPKRYYLELRLKRARELLLQTSMPIMAISTACGFQSPPRYLIWAKTNCVGVFPLGWLALATAGTSPAATRVLARTQRKSRLFIIN